MTTTAFFVVAIAPFMTATVMEKSIATGCGVHMVTLTVMETIELLSPFRFRCRHSVNEPSMSTLTSKFN